MTRLNTLAPRPDVLLTLGIVLALTLTAGRVHADPIRVSGQVYLDSVGGDFPDYHGPVNELVYFLVGSGLPAARGEAFETIPALGTRGDLQITRVPAPQPLIAGTFHDLSTHATFTFGRAFEDDWLLGGRAYDIAGDFVFTGGTAALQSGGFGQLIIGRSPVTFDGTLSGFDIDTGALLFRHSLRGSGTGEVTFAPSNPSFFQYSYSLDPVPEPTTLLLLGSGLLAVALRRRRRQSS